MKKRTFKLYKELRLSRAKKIANNVSLDNKKRYPTIQYIKLIVSSVTGVSINEIDGNSRKGDIPDARHLCMSFASQYCKMDDESIGNEIGERDRTTVIHGKKKIQFLYTRDLQLREHYNQIEKYLK